MLLYMLLFSSAFFISAVLESLYPITRLECAANLQSIHQTFGTEKELKWLRTYPFISHRCRKDLFSGSNRQAFHDDVHQNLSFVDIERKRLAVCAVGELESFHQVVVYRNFVQRMAHSLMEEGQRPDIFFVLRITSNSIQKLALSEDMIYPVRRHPATDFNSSFASDWEALYDALVYAKPIDIALVDKDAKIDKKTLRGLCHDRVKQEEKKHQRGRDISWLALDTATQRTLANDFKYDYVLTVNPNLIYKSNMPSLEQLIQLASETEDGDDLNFIYNKHFVLKDRSLLDEDYPPEKSTTMRKTIAKLVKKEKNVKAEKSIKLPFDYWYPEHRQNVRKLFFGGAKDTQIPPAYFCHRFKMFSDRYFSSWKYSNHFEYPFRNVEYEQDMRKSSLKHVPNAMSLYNTNMPYSKRFYKPTEDIESGEGGYFEKGRGMEELIKSNSFEAGKHVAYHCGKIINAEVRDKPSWEKIDFLKITVNYGVKEYRAPVLENIMSFIRLNTNTIMNELGIPSPDIARQSQNLDNVFAIFCDRIGFFRENFDKEACGEMNKSSNLFQEVLSRIRKIKAENIEDTVKEVAKLRSLLMETYSRITTEAGSTCSVVPTCASYVD